MIVLSCFFISALIEAQDIFGLDFDFDEFEKYGRDDYSSEEEEEDYEDDAEDGAPRRPKKKSAKKSIYEVSDSVALPECVSLTLPNTDSTNVRSIGHFRDVTRQNENSDQANKTHFHKKGFAIGLILRVRVFGTWKWPITAANITLLIYVHVASFLG